MTDLTCLAVPTEQIGYGRMGVKLIESLQRLGYDLRTDQDEPTGTLIHFSIPTHLMRWHQGQRLVILTMWESATMPEAFRESLHHFDLCVVPSEQNRELFSRYHPNVQVIDLGIDPDRWHPTKRTPPGNRFDFLHGGSGLRKGGDVVYEAFRSAFPEGSWGEGPTPWLTFKSPRANQFFGDRITQINGRLSAEDEIRLYANSHCYVQPSRGEGFGLQPLQAIAQGLPTILTDAHGHASFAHYGHPVPATLTPTPTGSFMLGEAGDWWEPDVRVVAERMRWVYDNYAEACADALASAHAVTERFTWDNSARQLMEHVGNLEPYRGDGSWVKPIVKRYRTILNRPHSADIAGYSFRWDPFTEYFEQADVRRILFEGGYLDPSCIDAGAGLTQEQYERFKLQSGTDSFCGTCHQRIASQPTRADLLYQEYEERAAQQ